jgi:hypothetical protein
MELEQKVNGKISYIPAIERGENITMILRNDGEES